MSRLIRDPDDIRFGRVAPGIYFKGDPAVALRGWGGHNVVTALFYAGKGSGLGRVSALHWLGWSTQHPVRLNMSTTRRCRGWYSDLVYHRHPNLRRNELNWTEVTLLEAIHDIVFVEDDWELCLRQMREGWTLEWLPWQPVQEPIVRTDLMLWAAEPEKLKKANRRWGCRDLSGLRQLIEDVGEAANAPRPDNPPLPGNASRLKGVELVTAQTSHT